MIEALQKYKTAILLILLLGGGFLTFNYFSGDNTGNETLITTIPGDESSVGRELLSLLNDLQGITFDASVVEDPVYQSLIDFSVPIAPQPKGRTNPFLPLGR